MADTKENILMTALHLFAQDGYEAVSVSMIADRLGITKGALYKHYRNKRDIFDSIVARMYQIDAERAREYEVPEEKRDADPGAYENISVNSIRNYTTAQFVFWTEDDFASHFRKMLTLEQYRSAEMAELYENCFTSGPAAYMEDIFREMIRRGILQKADPKLLAAEYYAPLYLLISAADRSKDAQAALALLCNHIDRFFQQNMAGDSGKEDRESCCPSKPIV